MKMDWDKFVRNTWNSYTSVAIKMLGNSQDAEDVVQDVYLSMFKRGYDTYEDYVSVGFKAVKNGCFNHINRAHTKRSSGMLDVTGELEYDNSPNALDMMQEEYVLNAMKKHLSPNHFGAITAAMAGMGDKDTASAYGINVITARVRLHYARDKMKKYPELFGY